MSLLAGRLEDRCRRLVGRLLKPAAEPTPVTFVVREMALTLDHLDVFRQRQRALESWFVEKQLDLNTQIMRLKTNPILKDNWVEQTRFRNEFIRMLDANEWRTTRAATEISTSIQQLQTRLLELWNIYDQISTHDGDTQGTA
jgi:hypothetical protein